MNFASPYASYVLAAYGVSGVGLLLMAWRSWRHWRQANRAWQGVKAQDPAAWSEDL